MSLVLVAWARCQAPWDEATLTRARAALPAPISTRMPRYRRWQDVQQSLLGKLLLRWALTRAGREAACMARMVWSDAGRPSIPGVPDFNIAHCDGLVACALGDGPRLGIDVERIRPLPIDDLARVLTEDERAAIEGAADRAAELLRVWTFKEAVAKADGRGVGIDLHRVDSLGRGEVALDSARWLVQPLTLDPAFACHLASEGPVHLQVVEVEQPC